jgi:nucleoid-associated protein YgaU
MTKKIAVALILVLAFSGILLAKEKRLTDKEAKAMIEEYMARTNIANSKIADLQPNIDALAAQIANLDKEIADLESQLAECGKKPKYYGKYTVASGDFLTSIAAKREVYHDGTKWPMIYEANKDLIKNPDFILPGWLLFIPGLDVYKVIPGDCLWMIADYITIYGKARDWPKIFEANKDKIKDADLIFPGQEFKVPRN